MAHHNSTPASVLTAPQATFILVPGTEQPYQNRAARRHWQEPREGGETGATHIIHPMNENLGNTPAKVDHYTDPRKQARRRG
jgi:hypothetical protein